MVYKIHISNVMPMRILRSLIFIFAVAIIGCGEKYPTEAKLYCDKAVEILIEKGVCEDKQDCSRKEVALWAGCASWRKMTHLSLYGISDREVVNAVAERLRLERVRLEPGISIIAYRSHHLQPSQKLMEIIIK